MEERTPDRREVLTTGAVVAAGLLAGCAGGDGGDGGGESPTPTDEGEETTTETTTEAGGNETGGNETGGNETGGGGEQPSFDGWLADTSNYDGVEDVTGQEGATVMVGAEGNGGNLAFEPAAVRIDAGTTVTWEWTGQGGSHNVKHQDGNFESEYHDQEGATFEHTFEEAGTYKYLCVPHQSQGMKGVVVVE